MKSFALIVLSVILTSCTLAQTRNNSVPSELVGNWYQGTTSALAYLDRSTGIADAAGGNGTALNIKADGTFTKAQLAKAGLYGCSTVVFGYQTGKVGAAGDVLTFTGKTFFVSYKDSCNPQTNSEKNAKPINREYQYELRTDASGRTLLCLNEGKEEEEECFWKEEKQ